MTATLEELLQRRRSTRAYTSAGVDRRTLELLFEAARKAPSGANLQPGKFHALTGTALTDLSEILLQAELQGRPHDEEYSYFPKPMPPELLARQRATGKVLYDSMGIKRRDVQARRDAFARNYAFFSAPVGIIATIDRRMGSGCFMDMGMSVMAFFLAAESLGLASSGIGALANHGRLIHEHLSLPEEEMVVCGIALGYADKEAAVNRATTDRLPLSEFVSFSGFED